MSEARQIASTILQQIKAIEFWALGAWGARGFTAFNAGQNSDVDDYILGGVNFAIKTPKYRTCHFVNIYLRGDDTYTVVITKIRNMERSVVSIREDVYCDMLVEVIDSLIENKR